MLNYLLEVTLCWAGFYGLYALMLGRTTFFGLNRGYLMVTLLLGAVVPLLPLPEWSPPPEPVVYYLAPLQESVHQVELSARTVRAGEVIAWSQVFLGVYLLGLALAMFRLLYGLVQLGRLYRRGERVLRGGVTLVYTAERHLPFSFFHLLFWSRSSSLDEAENRSIFEHEQAHIRGWHSLDVLLTELIGAFFWCSPMVYLYRRSIRQVHEYLADRAATAEVRPKTYGRMLLRQSQSDLQLAFAHHLLQSPLKKRIDMMTRHRTAPAARLRYVLALPLLLLFMLVFANRELIGQTLMEIHRPDGTVEKHQVDPDNLPDGLVDPEQIASIDVRRDSLSRIIVRLKADPTPVDTYTLEELVIVGYGPERSADAPASADGSPFSGIRIAGTRDDSIEYRLYLPDGSVLEGPDAAARAENLAAEQVLRVDVTKESGGSSGLIEIYLKGYDAVETPAGVEVGVDRLPRFPGCEQIGARAEDKEQCAREKLFGFLGSEVRYPLAARQAGAEGLVVVEFIVTEDGEVRSPRVVRSLHPDCDAEALRVVRAMPAWTPGREDGKAVPVKLQLPFTFKIEAPAVDSPAPAVGSGALELDGFSVAPNPASGQARVRFQGPKAPIRLQISDLQGRTLWSESVNGFDGSYDEQLDLSAWPGQTLLLTVLQGEKAYTHRILRAE